LNSVTGSYCRHEEIIIKKLLLSPKIQNTIVTIYIMMLLTFLVDRCDSPVWMKFVKSSIFQ